MSRYFDFNIQYDLFSNLSKINYTQNTKLYYESNQSSSLDMETILSIEIQQTYFVIQLRLMNSIYTQLKKKKQLNLIRYIFIN